MKTLTLVSIVLMFGLLGGCADADKAEPKNVTNAEYDNCVRDAIREKTGQEECRKFLKKE